MSPASSGPLEVERYIGACLISSQQSRHKKGHYVQQHHHQGGHHQPHHPQHHQAGQHHHHHQHHQPPNLVHPDNLYGYHRLQRCNSDGGHWAGNGGGVPLLYNHHYNHNPHGPTTANENLSRLAVQTQGIPLILSNKYHNRRNKHRNAHFNAPGGASTQGATANGPGAGHGHSVHVNNVNLVKDLKDVKVGGKQPDVGQCTDTVSIASDESCASNTSDTCLPRIIKPRKRRKKDRKPQHHLRTLQVGANGGGGDSAYSSAQDTCSSGSSATSSPDIDYFAPPANFYAFNYNTRRQQHVDMQHVDHTSTILPARPTHEDKNEAPKLSHLFEDVCDDLDAKDLNGNEMSCQCRYCDPSGQIWDMDVDRGCYSPYLTSSLHFGSTGYVDPVSDVNLGHLLGQNDFNRAPSRPSLRRHSSDAQSLLESLSTMSLDDDSTSSSLSSSSSSSSVPTTMLSTPNSPNLEVSTEIVTSHNGHRDLEIKFFSIFSSGSEASKIQDKLDHYKNMFGDDAVTLSQDYNKPRECDEVLGQGQECTKA